MYFTRDQLFKSWLFKGRVKFNATILVYFFVYGQCMMCSKAQHMKMSIDLEKIPGKNHIPLNHISDFAFNPGLWFKPAFEQLALGG